MSDIDYEEDDYYYDEDDVFWIEDETLDLADDLAEHALPSPVLGEDPHIESLQGYSDWEYYSDDYWDEDSSALRQKARHPPASEGTQKQEGPRLLKKRKITTDVDVPRKRVKPLKSKPTPDQVFYGTLWRQELSLKHHIGEYIPGQQDRVALLKDWRDIFRDTQPRSDKWREERMKATRKRSVQSSIDENERGNAHEQDLSQTTSSSEATKLRRGKRQASGGSSKPVQRSTGENQQNSNHNAYLQPDPKLPPRRRRKVEIEETKKVQNGVISNSVVTATIKDTPKPKSKKRSRADEEDEPPPAKTTRITRRTKQ